MAFEREINWLVEKLLQEYPQLEKQNSKNQMSARDWLSARIVWGLPKGFVYFWVDEFGPYGGIMIRPVNDTLVTQGSFDYWGTIWEFDPAGTILWVDYAFGHGLYEKMLRLCRSTNLPRLGWRHRDRMHVESMDRMPRKAMKAAFHV